MSIEVRPYSESDETGVLSLWQEVFPDNPLWNDPREDIRRKLRVQPEGFLVAEVDGRVVGTAMAGHDGHRGWVYYLGVCAEFRRQGVGTALLLRVEEWLTREGCIKLNLQVRPGNDEAVEFYETVGYRVEPRVSMGKMLWP